MIPDYIAEFRATLFRVAEPGGWVFAEVPGSQAPTVTLGWGRTPVHATVDGMTWKTSVWRERSGRTLLAVPRRIRGKKDHGDTVEVRIDYSISHRP